MNNRDKLDFNNNQQTSNEIGNEIKPVTNYYSKSEKIEQDRGLDNSGEIKPYKLNWISRIPPIVKNLFIKWWFAGALFYFIGLGIPVKKIGGYLGLIIAIGLAMGLATDLLVYRFFDLINDDKGSMDRYMLTVKRTWYSIFINTIYSLIIAVIVAFLYGVINLIINTVNNYSPTTQTFLAEPILFGVFYALIDLLILTIRNLIFYKKYYPKETKDNV